MERPTCSPPSTTGDPLAHYQHLRAASASKSWWNPKKWVINVAIAVDQLGNAITGGSPDETISSRWGRASRRGAWYGRAGCSFLGWLDPGHCEKAIQAEQDESHQHPEIRGP